MLSAIAAVMLATAVVLDGDPVSSKNDQPMIGFDVYRKGERIGRHEIAFRQADDALRVEVSIDLSITFLFFTAYSYEHRVVETWRDGGLVALQSRTDNNGEPMEVEAKAAGDRLDVIPAIGASYVLNDPILPTTYWHPRTQQAERLLNTQTGETMDVTIAAKGEREMRSTPWGPVEVQQYLVEAARDWSIWYDPAGCLAGIAFTDKRGAPIEYRLTDYPNPDVHSWIAETPLLSHFAGCAIGKPSLRATADMTGTAAGR